MFLSRHASNPDNLALLQSHLDSVCTGMLDSVVPLSRQQQMNSNLDDDNVMYEPEDDLSIEHLRFCRETPVAAIGPAILTQTVTATSASLVQTPTSGSSSGVVSTANLDAEVPRPSLAEPAAVASASLTQSVTATSALPVQTPTSGCSSGVVPTAILDAEVPPPSLAEPAAVASAFLCPYPERPTTFDGLLPHCDKVAPLYQLHKCVRRCRAGKRGQVQCSARFCRNLTADTTIAQYTGEVHDSCDFEMPSSVKVVRLPAIEPMVSIRPDLGRPVGEIDGRCLCIDIKRPRLQDGFTAEHNKLLTACVTCNNCWMCFGVGQEGKNVSRGSGG